MIIVIWIGAHGEELGGEFDWIALGIFRLCRLARGGFDRRAGEVISLALKM